MLSLTHILQLRNASNSNTQNLHSMAGHTNLTSAALAHLQHESQSLESAGAEAALDEVVLVASSLLWAGGSQGS